MVFFDRFPLMYNKYEYDGMKMNTEGDIARNYFIDLLRGIAIITVLFHHFYFAYHLDRGSLNPIFAINFIQSIAHNGNYGVTMFFVISGFLITSTTIDRYGSLGKVDVIGFYIFRFARIIPCLILALGMLSFFNLLDITVFENKANSISLFVAILSVLTFWHNVLMESVGYFNYCLNIFWSLSVEEVFYLLFPLVGCFFKKLRFIIPIWITAIIVGPLYRSYHASNEIIAVYGYFSCFDAIALGCCSAIVAKRVNINQYLKKTLQCSAGILIFALYCCVNIMENIVWCFSILALATAILLVCATKPSSELIQIPSLFQRIIGWFGKLSYELYLFHIIILALMKQYIKADLLSGYEKLLLLIIFFVLSAFVAGFIEKFYSNPLNKNIRKTFFSIRKKISYNKPNEIKAYLSN